MTQSSANASGDQPPADPGLTSCVARSPAFGSGALTAANLAARLAADGDLTAEDIAALARLDDEPCADGDSWNDDPGSCAQDDHPCSCPRDDNPYSCAQDDHPDSCPQDDHPGLGGHAEPPVERPPLSDEYVALMDTDPVAPRVAEVLDAGFTHRLPTPGATGFAAGGPLDGMLPGPDLAWHVGQARRRGPSELSDQEVCGLMGAAQRLESWAAGLKLTFVNELDARRAGKDGRPGEHVADEVGAVFILTPRSADHLIGLTRNLVLVPQTRALLGAGILDLDRAEVIADALAVLDPAGAAMVENLITPRAADLTTGQLRAACERAIKAYDPQAATRRREKAQRDARVECWAEAAGTSAIAGRDLAPAGVIAADKTLDADARWLRQHGMPGSHDQRRAAAFLARLTNRPLATLLPAADAAPADAPSTNPAAPPSTNQTAPPSTNPTAPPSTNPTAPPSTNPTAPPSTNPTAPRGSSPADMSGASSTSAAGWVGGLGGTVNLTMPASAWLGLSDAPGEAGGPGAVDADTCRDLAAALAANPATRWCVTIVDSQGRPTAHGCARDGPGPRAARDGPGSPGGTDPVAWLATVKISPIETGTCSHRRESAGYQPSNLLRHIIKIRSPRCGFPGCRRPAIRCDDDHTIPYDKGGRTCECNLHPLCRRHHQTKQAPGWHLDQPEPGTLIWTLPSGRTCKPATEPYPV